MAGVLTSIDISARGLTVQRAKMNVIAENLANAETTQTPEGGPYRRKRVLVREDQVPGGFSKMVTEARISLARTDEAHKTGKKIGTRIESTLSGAAPVEVRDPASSYKLIHDPSHPEADDNGYVKMPDVDVVIEMTDMMLASRAYEANTTAIAASKKMIQDTLEI